MSKPLIKAFIIDDSSIIRFALAKLLGDEGDIVVVGDAPFTASLSSQIEHSGANMLILDIPVPREKGIQEMKKLHKFHLPVIVFTKSNDSIARDLIPLLDAGAVGFVIKPDKTEELSLIKAQLLHELRLNVQSIPDHPKGVKYLDPQWVVAIGSSTGGPEALAKILPQFPKSFRGGVVIVQHMPPDFTTRFAARLNGLSNLPVKEAATGDLVEPGQILIAPGDFHLVFKEICKGNRRVAQAVLTKDPPMWKLRPTVDRMMLSLAPIFGQHLVGIILTGMGEDGVVGMRSIKRNGGHTLVQNKETSVVFGMAQEVIKSNLADEVLALDRIIPRALNIVPQ